MINLEKEEFKYKKTVALKKEVCEILDTLKPFETITITADQSGSKNKVVVNRKQTVILKGKK